jgi:hypothetical protein
MPARINTSKGNASWNCDADVSAVLDNGMIKLFKRDQHKLAVNNRGSRPGNVHHRDGHSPPGIAEVVARGRGNRQSGLSGDRELLGES